MGLFRLLFLLAIIAAAIWLWRRFTRPTTTRPSPDDSRSQPAPMVRCAQCGVHTPRIHALTKDNQWFCSQAHLEQGPRSRGQ